MVCLGNICRSPLAEGILSAKVPAGEVIVDSAGTAGYHIGKRPDPRSIEIAARNGIDISHQRCRRFTPSDYDAYDHIFAMDRENLMDLKAQARNPGDLEKLSLLLAEAGLPEEEVPDPYYGGPQGFAEVYRLIDTATDRLLATLLPK
jgi:protein-tyrosine phosphatase